MSIGLNDVVGNGLRTGDLSNQGRFVIDANNILPSTGDFSIAMLACNYTSDPLFSCHQGFFDQIGYYGSLAGGRFRLFDRDGGNTFYNLGLPEVNQIFGDGKIHAITFEREGVNHKIKVDGKLLGVITTPSVITYRSTLRVFCGDDANTQSNLTFFRFAVFDRLLTDNECLDWDDSQALLAHDFNYASGRFALDTSGNGKHLVSSNLIDHSVNYTAYGGGGWEGNNKQIAF